MATYEVTQPFAQSVAPEQTARVICGCNSIGIYLAQWYQQNADKGHVAAIQVSLTNSLAQLRKYTHLDHHWDPD
ncbi:putative Ig lambda chain V-VI region EB4 isoform X2, partial [Sciurus carolinensis]|nr:putative Ig lambda chain V-VI region EB4 isoform X2 [Sciurus carolinensis]